jgi:glutamine amidotransferase
MPGKITIVDYGLGNVGSVLNMLRYLGVEAESSADPCEIDRADKLILGGVGAFDAGMERLKQRSLVDPLNEAVMGRGVPVLGICLGMQLMTERSEEGASDGLGWVPGETVRLRDPGADSRLRIPHMGWNEVRILRECPLAEGLPSDSRFYFVHSYHVVCRDAADVVATTEYGGTSCAMLQKGRIFGTQFHPEKSHRFGMTVLRNFASMVA